MFGYFTRFGISLFPSHGESAEALLTKADLAMYTVKKRGRNHFQIYQSGMEKKINNNLKPKQDPSL